LICISIIEGGKKLHIKLITAIVVVLIIGINIFPLIDTVKSCSCSDPPCWPEFSGTMGDNNWYVSNVVVTFNGSGNRTCYRIDGGGWIEYVVPFMLNADGIHFFEWTCDYNMSEIYSVEIKIDQTQPNVTFTAKRVGFFKWRYTANASDEISGINRVEFYIDSTFINNDTEPPYEAFWTGFWFILWLKYRKTGDMSYLPMCIPYDNAGNCPMSPSFKYKVSTMLSLFLF
jgi:hypothetical protein